MIIKLYVLQFINDLKHQKLRAILTLFGLIWGTTAIMLLLSIGESIKKQMFINMHGMGEGICIIWPGQTSKPFAGFGKGREIRLFRDDILLIKKHISQIRFISGEQSNYNIPIKFGKKNVMVNLTGVEAEWGEMRNVIPQMGGRFLHPDDIEEKRRVVFIGNKLKENLIGDEDAIGKSIIINGIPFTVIGVLKPKQQNSSYSGRDESKAIIPITTYMLMFDAKTINNLVYSPKNKKKSEETEKKIKEFIAKLKKFDPTDPDALWVWNTSEMDKFLGYFTIGLQLFFGIVGIFTLIVAGIGVANIMNVVVEERTKEIGIKLALGIKKKWILFQFLFETFFLTFLGGFIGFIISASICAVINQFPQIEDFMGKPHVTLPVALITTAVLGLVAFLSGYYPAKRASKLNPVEALRW